MKYNFTLKDNNEKSYKQFIWFLFFLHIVAAGLFALNAAGNLDRLSAVILLGFFAILYIVYYFFRKHVKAFETFSLILALLYANFWFQHVGIIAVIIFALVYLVVVMLQGKKTTVLFSEEGVHLTRVFKTVVFPWAALDNVILKDNLLTIDFKTNKIIQVEIAEPNKALDEMEFNLFCTGQMKSKA